MEMRLQLHLLIFLTILCHLMFSLRSGSIQILLHCTRVDQPRPIAVVPILAKILEKIVSEQLENYLEANSLLHPDQGTYRRGRNTEDILLAAVDHIVHSLDAGDAVCAAFLDFCKAFDSLDHYVLLSRLYDRVLLLFVGFRIVYLIDHIVSKI